MADSPWVRRVMAQAKLLGTLRERLLIDALSDEEFERLNNAARCRLRTLLREKESPHGR